MNVRLSALAILTLSIITTKPCLAEMDAATRSALAETQKLLSDPAALEKLMTTDAGARKADQSALALTGGGTEHRELYEIASEIFGSLVESTGGDVSKLQQLMTDSQKNPEKLYEKLSAAQKARIKTLAAKINGSMAKGVGGGALKRP